MKEQELPHTQTGAQARRQAWYTRLCERIGISGEYPNTVFASVYIPAVERVELTIYGADIPLAAEIMIRSRIAHIGEFRYLGRVIQSSRHIPSGAIARLDYLCGERLTHRAELLPEMIDCGHTGYAFRSVEIEAS